MRKLILVLVCAVFLFGLSSAIFACKVLATNDPGTLKQEIEADKQAIKDKKEEIKGNAQAARAEEKDMRGDIKDAITSGDKDKAKELRQQLKAEHKENVQQKKADKIQLKSAKKELKQDRNAAKALKKGKGK